MRPTGWRGFQRRSIGTARPQDATDPRGASAVRGAARRPVADHAGAPQHGARRQRPARRPGGRNGPRRPLGALAASGRGGLPPAVVAGLRRTAPADEGSHRKHARRQRGVRGRRAHRLTDPHGYSSLRALRAHWSSRSRRRPRRAHRAGGHRGGRARVRSRRSGGAARLPTPPGPESGRDLDRAAVSLGRAAPEGGRPRTRHPPRAPRHLSCAAASPRSPTKRDSHWAPRSAPVRP